MPRLAPGQTRLRRDIEDALAEYVMNRNYIGLKLYPVFPVTKEAGFYPVIPAEAVLKLPADIRRAPRGAYHRMDWNYETDSYACIERGVEDPVDAVEAAQVADYFDAEKFAAQRAVDVLLRMQEQRILTHLQTFAVNQTVGNEWNDTANATPLADTRLGIRTLYEATGLRPDTMVIGFRAYQALPLVDEIAERLKYTIPGTGGTEYTPAVLARLFELRQVLIADQIYDAADEGLPKEITRMWDDDLVMLLKVAEGEMLKQPCIGRTFLYTPDSPSNVTMDTYEEPQTRTDIVRARHYTDEEDIMTACAWMIDNIIDPAIVSP